MYLDSTYYPPNKGEPAGKERHDDRWSSDPLIRGDRAGGTHLAMAQRHRPLPLCAVKVHNPSQLMVLSRSRRAGARVTAEPETAGGDPQRVDRAQRRAVPGQGVVKVDDHRQRRTDLPAVPCTLL